MWKTIIGFCDKNRNKYFKNCFKKLSHKATEATVEFLRTKIANKIVKPDGNSRNVEEIIITPEKREEVLNLLNSRNY